MTAHLYGNAGPNLESAEPEADQSDLVITPGQAGKDSTITSEDSGENRVIDPATVSSKVEREKQLNRERVRRFRQKHKKHGKLVEISKTERADIRDTTSKKAATQSTLDVTHFLFMIHSGLGVIFTNPDIEITEEEAKRLASAITRVTQQYKFPIWDEKTAAWMNLGMVGIEVYGTRAMAAMAKRKKKALAPQIITPIPPMGA